MSNDSVAVSPQDAPLVGGSLVDKLSLTRGGQPYQGWDFFKREASSAKKLVDGIQRGGEARTFKTSYRRGWKYKGETQEEK